MNKELLDHLNAIEASLDTLVRSLTTTQTYTAGPKAARDLIKADDDLQAALTRLRTHQENFVKLQKLRAEADALNAKLKDTVLTAVALRKELGEIHPSILEDSDEEDEEEVHPVNYETLLAFATRIGKHNAIAAQEAEKLVEEQYLKAKKSRDQGKTSSQSQSQSRSHSQSQSQSLLPNGILPSTNTTINPQSPTIDTQLSAVTPNQTQSQAQQTSQVTTQISEFANRRTWDRAQTTAPFPNSEILRIGELGKLQIQREQNGDAYADGHLEMLIRQSELKETAQTERQQNSSAEQVQPTVGARRPAERRPESKPKKALNLDFPDDDEEDSDEG